MDGVSRWAAAHGRTVQDVLLACWQLLMGGRNARISCSGRIARTVARRSRTGARPLTKTLPVRFTVDPRWSFATWWSARAPPADHVRWQSLFAWNTVDAREEAGPAPFCPLVFDAVDWTPIRSGHAHMVDQARGRVSRSCRPEAGLALTGAGWQARWTYDEQVHHVRSRRVRCGEYISVLRPSQRWSRRSWRSSTCARVGARPRASHFRGALCGGCSPRRVRP